MPRQATVRKLSIVALALLSTFALLPSQASHSQTQPNGDVVSFTQVGGNEWWVQVRLAGPDGPTASSVSAMDTGGAWVPLKVQTWTSDRTWWAGSFHIEPGHQVRFSASFPDGVTGFLSCWFDFPTGVERCGTASSSSSSTSSSSSSSTSSWSSSTTAPPANVLFTQVGGNEYWVQVRLAGSAGPSATSVRAMDTNGPWVALSPQTWTSDHTWWAGSFRIEAGHQVRFEATLPGGSTVLSCWFDHRTGTERCGGTTPSLAPEGIHIGTRGDLRNSVTVAWRIVGQDAAQAVEYGPTTAYGTRVPATGKALPSGGTLYTVSLSGLAPDTTYHYRVGSSGSGWSPDETFRTAPADRLAREVRIGFLGDTGINPQAAATIARLDAADLDAVVHVGDHAYATQPSDWDLYMRQLGPAAEESPFLAAIGNHEVEACCGLASFTDRFALPGNEMWWSTDTGNVHLVVLNSEPTTGDGHFPENTNVFSTSSPQYQWLEEDLAAAKATGRYIVVAFHRPIYSSNTNHPSNAGMRSVLEPLFDRMEVDLVMTGHAHDYERSYPLEGGMRTSTDLATYTRGSGTIHLITGGGGRPLYDSWQPQPQWSAVRASVHEWVELVAGTDGSLRVVARRTNEGTVLDSFTILPAGTVPTSTSREAEAFAIRTAGGRQADPAASAGAVWNLWSNGHIQDGLDAGSGGNLVVVARGQPLGGVWPTMVVSVDGTVVRTVAVTSSSLTPYVIGPVAGGSHTVRVAFTNDASSASEDRNLVLDSVRIGV